MKKETSDPSNYRKMSEPFPDRDAANDAVNAFYDELAGLRKKHHIADCLVVIQTNVTYESDEGSALMLLHLGSSLNALPMAAFAYGHLRSEQLEKLNTLLANKGTKKA